MGALNSLAMWGGLAAAGVAVPIIIHLLYRKHRMQTDWAAMELLRRAMVIRSGQVKFEDLLILMLRCLVLLLVAAALLRPILSSDSVSWLGEKRVGMVVAIDASYSMNHGEHSRYEKALTKTLEILGKAQQGDPVSLVRMSNRPQILLRRTGYDAASFNDVLDAQTEATPYGLNLERNLEQLEELASELKTPAREVYLVTDAQERDWQALSPSGRDTLARLTGQATVFVVPVATDGEENLGLTRLAYASGSLQKSGVARFDAEVRNQGRRQSDGGTIEFFVEDDRIARRAVGPLDAGKSRVVSFFAEFNAPGDIRLKAQLARDELTDDNERFAVVNIRPRIRVLCVDDAADNSGADRTGAYYAVRALRLRQRDAEEGAVQVQQTSAADLSLETLSDFDVVLLANVADLAPEMVKRLDEFVRRGGGLILFLGDRVDAELYNQRFGSGENGLLPGKLGETITVKEDNVGWALGPVKSDHSLAAIVKRLPEGLVDAARFRKVIQAESAQGSETILTIAEQTAPLLLSRRIDGAGSVLMFTTSADRTWNDLPVHPLYTMLLQQAVTNLSSDPDGRQITVGEPAELAVPGRQVGDQVELTPPKGGAANMKVTLVGPRPVCAIDAEAAGIYAIASGPDTPGVAVAANVDAGESNVRAVDAGALSSQLEPLGVQVVTESAALAAAIDKSRQGRELAFILLVLGIIVFLLQSFLAMYFTRRISSGESDVSASLQKSRVAAARRS